MCVRPTAWVWGFGVLGVENKAYRSGLWAWGLRVEPQYGLGFRLKVQQYRFGVEGVAFGDSGMHAGLNSELGFRMFGFVCDTEKASCVMNGGINRTSSSSETRAPPARFGQTSAKGNLLLKSTA